MIPGPRSLEAILKRCGIAIGADQVESLWRYHQLLRRANARLNLTRIHNFENMVLKHYVDSLLVLKHVELPTPLIDMGSGPGLPGIPLKIARPGVRMILAEPRGARAEFLREVVAELELKNTEVYAHKLGADYPGQVGGVISRAVAAIPDSLDRVAACLAPGGEMIFMKGPECDDEVAEAEKTHAGIFRQSLDRAYSIPGTPHRRRLLVYQRLDGDARAARSRSRATEARDDPREMFGGIIREINSASNPTFQRCKDLLSGPGIRKHGEALMAGVRVRDEILEHHRDAVLGWISGLEGPPPEEPSIPWLRLSEPLFKELDVAGTHAPLLLVKVPEIASWSDSDPWPAGCTLFVPFQDPENVGAVIRSAAAFGVARVVLLREAAHPLHPRSCRAAGPAVFQVPLQRGPSLAELQVEHEPLIALDTTGPELSDAPFPNCFGLVVGVEGPGLTPRLRAGERRRIAIEPGVESINAATAAAIALYVWSRRRESSS